MFRKIRESFNPGELTYPANLLTLVRLLLIWPTIRYLLRPGGNRKALVLIGLGMATDAIDGPIARSRGEVSNLGKLLDPIADKLILDGVALALSARHGFPWWVTYLLLARDAAIVTGSSLILRRSSYITTSIWAGKATTAGLSITFLLYILEAQPWARRLLTATLLTLGISWAQYGMRYWEWLQAEEESQ